MSKKITVSQLTQAIRQTLGTPFHHGGRVNQVGLDCGGIIVVALRSLGVEVEDKEHYDRGDGLNDMLYMLDMNNFSQLSTPTPREYNGHIEIKPGSLILLRTSAMYHHLVYYTEDQTIIHAWFTTGVNKVVETTMLPEWWNCIHSIWRYDFLED